MDRVGELDRNDDPLKTPGTVHVLANCVIQAQ